MIEMPDTPTWPAMDADERSLLDGFLDAFRAVLLRKAAGLGDDDLAMRLGPSALTLGGLLKHMALVEDIWFTQALLGEALPEPWASVDWDADPDWELHSAVHDPPEVLHQQYVASIERSRAVAAGIASLDHVAAQRSPEGYSTTLRWIMVHMIEEYARHCGHADLLREAVDGATGD